LVEPELISIFNNQTSKSNCRKLDNMNRDHYQNC